MNDIRNVGMVHSRLQTLLPETTISKKEVLK